jgi:hypothetical protein
MIVFLTTATHSYTHRALIGADAGLEIGVMNYAQAQERRQFPRATYVFTDLDRLPTESLNASAQLYLQLRGQGVRVLNNPARVLSRYGLLRALFRRGVNRFNAYRIEEGVMPRRWPVFLRTDGTHEGPLPELYGNPEVLKAGIESAIAQGLPLSRLLIVEFMAEPARPGLYRKLSCFRIGPASVAHTCVHDTDWVVKLGKLGITPPDLYEDELRIVRDNPYGVAVAQAFETADIEYGRVDFGIVNGKLEIYEINTNPHIKLTVEHPSPTRIESCRVFGRNFLAALRAVDSP